MRFLFQNLETWEEDIDSAIIGMINGLPPVGCGINHHRQIDCRSPIDYYLDHS